MFRVKVDRDFKVSKFLKYEGMSVVLDAKEETIKSAVKRSADIIAEELINGMLRKRKSIGEFVVDYQDGNEKLVLDFYVMPMDEYIKLERKIELLEDIVKELRELL